MSSTTPHPPQSTAPPPPPSTEGSPAHTSDTVQGVRTPPPSSPPHLISSSGKRAYPRMAMALTVEIEGTTYDCQDWSLGGFGLYGGGPAGGSGDLFDVSLRLQFPHFEAVVPVTAKAVRVIDGMALGFRFVDLTAEKAATLNYVADSYLAGDLGSVGGMMEAGGKPGQITFAEDTVFWLRRIKAALRYGVTLAIAIAIIAFSGFSIVSTLLTIRSEHAAVSSGLKVIRTPDAGFLTSPPRPIGSVVHRGDILFSVQPPERQQEIARLQDEIRLLDTRLANQTGALQQADAALAAFHQRTRAELTATAGRLRAAQAEEQAQTRIFNRLGRLVASGNLSQTYVDRQEILLREKQRMVADITAEQVRLEQSLSLSENGLFNSEGRNTQPTPGDIRRSITELETERATRQTTLSTLATPLTVASPCDCTVQAVSARSGEFIEKGSVVYAFATGTEGPSHTVEVDVLLPVDKIRLLRVGQSADIRLATAPDDLTGTIVRLTFNPENTGRTGLPDTLRTLGRFALVTVRLPADGLPADALATGLPAIATFRVEAGSLLHYLTGFHWLLPSADIPS